MYSIPGHLAAILRNAQGVTDRETGRDVDVGRECLLIREEWEALHKELARVREERDSVNRALAEAHDKYAKQAKMLIEEQERVARRAAVSVVQFEKINFRAARLSDIDEIVAQEMREAE